MKKVGIITFHNSYNCGSMLESYAIFKYLLNKKLNVEIINFSNQGQKNLYSVLEKNTNIKKVIKNILVYPHRKQIENNNRQYEEFKNRNFVLSKEYNNSNEIKDIYDIVVAGSDQIWNITIPDADEAYFLNWTKKAKKVAYAPSFGARSIPNYTNNPKKYYDYLKKFDAISIREKNGQKWIKEYINKEVPILIDPTLLLSESDYESLLDNNIKYPEKYIFFYSPDFNSQICKLVKKISKKYKMPVITWSAKKYYIRFVKRFGFSLADYESPSVYLTLIKNASLVITTSFHGTIFSSIYKKNFFVIKNGEMFGDDDRVKTLIEQLGLKERLITAEFNDKFDYMKKTNYKKYDIELPLLQRKAYEYIEKNIEDCINETGK